MVAVASYGAIKPTPASRSSANKYAFVGIVSLAIAAVVAVAVISSPMQRRSELLDEFPQDDLSLIAVMQKMAGKPELAGVQTVSMAQSAPVRGTKKGLTMTEQYARIMQNMGYFAPWSRQNGWVDRVAIDNIRKANTPQALAQRAEQIKQENAKFAREFSSPHTSQYTGKHESLQTILDPKYQPWGNDGPRKAYYSGF